MVPGSGLYFCSVYKSILEWIFYWLGIECGGNTDRLQCAKRPAVGCLQTTYRRAYRQHTTGLQDTGPSSSVQGPYWISTRGLQHLHMVSLLSLQDAYRALTGSYRIPSGSLVDPHMVTRGSSQDPYSTTAVSLLDLDRIPTVSQ